MFYHSESLIKWQPLTCKQISCEFGAICHYEASKGSKCVCQFNCSNSDNSSTIISPVCGSDGLSYSSECDMNLYACKMQINLTIIHKGSCPNYDYKNSSSSSSSSSSFTDYWNNENTQSYTQQPWNELLSSSLSSSSSSLSVNYQQTTMLDSRSTREIKLAHNSQADLATIGESIISTTDPSESSYFDKSPEMIKVPAFSGQSYIEMGCLKVQLNLYIEIVLTSYTDSAIILYNGQTITGEGDFVAITLNQGKSADFYFDYKLDLSNNLYQ